MPLPPNVAFELRRHIKNHGVWGPERLLFPNVTRTGYVYASYFYRQIWTAALSKGGVPYCKPHSMRHFVSTWFRVAIGSNWAGGLGVWALR